MGHYLTFDGVSTSTYDIYISEEGVFNAPERDVETITIPGRNGDYQLDNGRFNNITVTYPAFNYESTMANFTQKLSNLRNQFASRVGYKRLTDSLHTDEYRMAIFKGGLEIDPLHYNTASSFDIVFDCKPQRFLTSGETAVTVANNGTITNPTLFDARPLLAVKGYGTLNIGGQPIVLDNSIPLGDVVVTNRDYSTTDTLTVPVRPVLASGNTFTIKATFTYLLRPTTGTTFNSGPVGPITLSFKSTGCVFEVTKTATFTYGTSYTSTQTQNVNTSCTNGGSTVYSNLGLQFSIAYNGSDTLTITNNGLIGDTYAYATPLKMETPDTTAYSTKSSLGNPSYIDLDIGEAYKIENNQIISINDAVQIGAELPVLKPGSNTITYSNTITEVKITPRWWKI